MVPPFPPNVRLATPEDLPRLGFVACAGYFGAPQFLFMKPNFRKYPGDSVARYQNGYRSALLHNRRLVLVAEDELDPKEDESICEELKGLAPRSRSEPGNNGKKVVVAVTSIDVPEKCEWAVRRRDQGINLDIPPVEDLNRDGSSEGYRLLGESVTPFIKKNTVDRATVHTMVLHPSYRGKRHGDALLKWVQDFFTGQGVGYYLAATPAGKKLYLRHGAKEVDTVEVPGYSEHPVGFTVSFCAWDPPETK